MQNLNRKLLINYLHKIAKNRIRKNENDKDERWYLIKTVLQK